MNKRIVDWENYEENLKKQFAERDLKKTKSGSIAFIKEIDELTNWEIYHAHWEDYLSSSDYWKNWRERINNFQTEKEVNFYTDRLRAFMEFVEKYTRKDIRYVEGAKQWDPETTPKLVEQELKRLESISEEEFKKTDKWSNSTEWREMTVKEISDALEYTPKTDKGVDKDYRAKTILSQANSGESQKDNEGIGAGGIVALISVASLVIIGGLVVVKKQLNKVKK